MNSSPEITIVSTSTTRPVEKATVPEMFLLYDLVAQSALKPAQLRAQLQQCTPEERAFLHRFFVAAATRK